MNTTIHHRVYAPVRALSILLMIGVFAGGLSYARADANPNAQSNLYLPLVTSTGGPPEPPPAVGGIFPTRDPQTYSAGAAVDAQGGMHFAYSAYVGFGYSSPAYYTFCTGKPASACGNVANWRTVALGNFSTEVQLALTPEGHPRLLITTDRAAEESKFGDNYKYAACDANCGSASSWTITKIGATSSIDTNSYDNPQRSFALDPQGRPRFVFYRSEIPHDELDGVQYMSCNIKCSSAANWTETRIDWGGIANADIFDYPSLTFTQAGQPRLVTQIFTQEEKQSGVYYLACDTNCTSSTNWKHVRLYDRGFGIHATWALALNATDQPRLAFYQAELDNGGGDRLYYAWCDTNCLTRSNWRQTTTGLAKGDGQDADLALDTQGRPRIAYRRGDSQGLGYLWCNADCTTPGGWSNQVAESNDVLDKDFPLPTPTNCDLGGWLGGEQPSLVLDAQGNPRIGSNALHVHAGGCTAGEDYRAVRWTFFPQP